MARKEARRQPGGNPPPPAAAGLQQRQNVTQGQMAIPRPKTDEPFYYIGTLDDLKRAIKAAGARLYIVEGEVDVWSLRALGIHNVIGTYSATSIPKEIDEIFTELGVLSFVYLADNDDAGEIGASNLRTLLHESVWGGAGEYRKVAGPGIPDKGDANDLLCHHYPDISAARAALDALPPFEPNLKRKQTAKPAAATDDSREGWDAVNQAITDELGLIASDFKANGYTRKNFHCLNPQHEDRNASAGWSRDGNYNCFVCGKIHSWQVAEWLNIDWRALLRPRPQIASSTALDLNAVPQADGETARLSFEQAPDSWLRLLRKFYKPIEAVLFLYVLRALKDGALTERFTRQELFKALPPVGCKVDQGAIYDVFQETSKHDNHALFVKIDPGQESGSRYCKFGLRPLEDIKHRLIHDIRLRVYEKKFHKHPDILIAFEIFRRSAARVKIYKNSESRPGRRSIASRKSVLIAWSILAKASPPAIWRNWMMYPPRRCRTGPSTNRPNCPPCWPAASTMKSRKTAAKPNGRRNSGLARQVLIAHCNAPA